MRRRVVEMIADNPGINGPELMRRIYADDPSGGAGDRSIISVFVHYARKQLLLDGFQIEYSIRGLDGGYRLRKINT